MDMEEQAWIRDAQQGDALALSKLLQKHYGLLRSYLLSITLHTQLAEDLTQETMLRVMDRIGLYNGQSKFSSWLITIATRLFIDHQRRRKRERLWQEQELSLRKLRWQAGIRQQPWSDALDALGVLTEDVRTAIVLKHYYGYSYEEIGEMTDVPAGTVKSRVHNGIKQLRKELASDEHDA
ncbi:RNA polymerase sigma factor SigY [Paenibacillus chartarius]|uniref:RNA polymerase sigma factor n=1 Tax=Paenibacillus chartarius TaxID=747481 RepID=A0ABV6DSI6_9BACL